MRKRKTTPAWKYIIPAILLHVLILLLPGHIYETFFPRSAPRDAGPPSDLTPDFEQFAIHIIYLEDEEPLVEITTNPTVEIAPLEVGAEYLERLMRSETGEAGEALLPVRTAAPEVPALDPAAEQASGAQAGGPAAPPPSDEGTVIDSLPETGGDRGIVVVEEPRFYPPVPRLIVPPSVENLDLADLTIALRILVSRQGRPLEVVIVNPPEDRLVYDSVMEAAKEFRFSPARRGEEPVEAWIELPLNLRTTRRD